MHRKEDERLSDTVVGEAVIELLDESAPVTDNSLLFRLQDFLSREENANRKKAVRRAIDTVKAATDRPGSLRQNDTLTNATIKR